MKPFSNFENFNDVAPLKELKEKIEELSSPEFYNGITQAGRMRRQGGTQSEALLQEIKADLVWNVFQHWKFTKI